MKSNTTACRNCCHTAVFAHEGTQTHGADFQEQLPQKIFPVEIIESAFTEENPEKGEPLFMRSPTIQSCVVVPGL
jgi:hypothetical protein